MVEENATLNTESSSGSEGELISTTDYVAPESDTDPGEANNTQVPEDEGSETEGGEPEASGEGETTDEGEELRFDKHPRFQELIKEKNTLAERLAAAEAKIDALATVTPETSATQPDFKDVTKMSEQDLASWMLDDPRGYHENLLTQIRNEVLSEIHERENEKIQEQNIDLTVKTLDEFASKHSDFDPMWDDGTIPKYMEEHPGHNAISAYYELTMDKTVQQQIEEAVSKAVKEKEAEIMKNIKAKREAVTLSSGPSAPRTTETLPPEMKEPKKFGGAYAVLASRLAERRRSQT